MRVIYATWLRIQCVGLGVHMNFGFSGWSVSITRSRSRAYGAQLRQCCLGFYCFYGYSCQQARNA